MKCSPATVSLDTKLAEIDVRVLYRRHCSAGTASGARSERRWTEQIYEIRLNVEEKEFCFFGQFVSVNLYYSVVVGEDLLSVCLQCFFFKFKTLHIQLNCENHFENLQRI